MKKSTSMFGTAELLPPPVYTAPHRTAYKNCGGPPTREDPPQFCVFCGLRNISFCRPVFKAAADTKGLVIRALYISHPKNAFAPTQYAVWRCPWARCPTRAAAHDVYSASAGASSGRYPENPSPSIAPISAISSGMRMPCWRSICRQPMAR